MMNFDLEFTPTGIKLTGPVEEENHQIVLQGLRVREVAPKVLNVQAQFEATDDEAGAELLRRFFKFLGSQGMSHEPGNADEVGTLDDRDDLDTRNGD